MPHSSGTRLAHAAAGHALEDDLGVGAAAEGDALALEAGAEIAVVVDLAVEGDDAAAVGRSHRLVAGRRQVDDGQPAEAERDAGRRVDAVAGVVGAAVHEGRGHRGDVTTQRVLGAAAGSPQAAQAAHDVAPPAARRSTSATSGAVRCSA